MDNKAQGFAAYEVIGIGIPNPRGAVRIPVPPNMTPEQLAAFEAEIDRINELAGVPDEG